MSEFVKVIREFPTYEITSYGRVFNRETGREMVLSINTTGDPTVGLVRDGHQSRRTVKILVADAFVPGKDEIFDTAIQLDGNKRNLHVDNIIWRPRWFAWLYTHQFNCPEPWHHYGPVVDVDTGQKYSTVLEASITNGVLCRDIRYSIYNGLVVFPTRQRFEYE